MWVFFMRPRFRLHVVYLYQQVGRGPNHPRLLLLRAVDSSIRGVDSATGLGTLHAFIVVLFGCLLDTFRLAAEALDSCVVGDGCVWW
jgi:hypothetical protein